MPMLTGTDVKDRRGSVRVKHGASLAAEGWNPWASGCQSIPGAVALGRLQQEPSKHWDSPSIAELRGKSRQSCGQRPRKLHCPLPPRAPGSSTYRNPQPSRRALMGPGLFCYGLKAFLVLLHHTWKHVPPPHRVLGGIFPAPPSSPQPPGCCRHLVWGRRNGGSAVGRGWLRRPWFSLQPCALPAAPSQHQARGKVFLAFSFSN